MKLKIGSKNLEFSFGLGFLGELVDETGKGIDEVLVLIDKNPYKFIPLAMYVSCKYAYESQDKEIDFTKHQFINWIDEDGGLTDKNESAIKFMKAFSSSLFKDVPKEDEVEGSKKKIDWVKDVLSVAVGELGLSMDYIKRMTWAEFRLRLFAYQRIQKNELYKVREVCYQIYVSNYYGKGKPVSKDRYWQIDKKEIGVNEKAIARLREAQQEYRAKKNG